MEPVLTENQTQMTQVNMRIKEDDLDLIKRAAEIEHRSFSSFVVSVAKSMAEQVIDQNARTTLGEAEWKIFTKRLNEEPKPLKNLAKLLRKKPLWEQ